jgi:mannobiose 2-epimerase
MRQALELHRILRKHARDARHGGWHGILRPDWTPIRAPEPGVTLEIPGQKSANATLHLMEALTELYAATRDPEVKASLEETLRIGTRHFFPKDPSGYRSHFHDDWSPVEGGGEAGSFGHDVEFAWLMIRAQQTLGVAPDWQHFHAYLEGALSRGFDEKRGGLYAHRASDGTPTDTDKIWWVQAELLAALTTALEQEPSERHEKAIAKLLDFVSAHLADPRDGIWIESVDAEGRPKKTAKAHNWKASYHEVRALVAFLRYAEANPAERGCAEGRQPP